MINELTEITEGLFTIPDAEYHSGRGISNSALNNLSKSPAHYKHALENPTEATPAMKFGSLVHTVILEPKLVDEQYAVAPNVDKRTKAGKATYAEFTEKAEGKTVVSQDDMDNALAMAESIAAHPLANQLITQKGVNERAIYSVDKDTGLLKRGKLDRLCEDTNSIIDLKTTTDGSPAGFTKSIFNYGYHRQASYYLDMAREQSFNVDRFLFVVVEKTPPFAVSVFEVDGYSLALGRKQYQENLKTLAKCLEEDHFPSYSDEIIMTETPNWASV